MSSIDKAEKGAPLPSESEMKPGENEVYIDHEAEKSVGMSIAALRDQP